MRKLFVILLALAFTVPLFGQARDYGIFTSRAEYDTLGASDDSLTTTVEWNNWNKMKGSLKVHGKMWLLTGSSVNITIKFKSINDRFDGDEGLTHTLGTITVADSARYEYTVSAETWWGLLQGYEVHYVPSATGSSVRIRGKELAK